MNRLVAYYRVSTDKQGESGLGLEAQKDIIQRHATAIDAKIIAEYIEVETGTGKRKRIEIEKACAQCKKDKAALIVAKLDRFARNTLFILKKIEEEKIKVIFCDYPTADEFMITILAGVAQKEAKLISERTKNALQALKAKGVKLGNPNIREVQKLAAEARRKQTKQKPKVVLTIKSLRDNKLNWQQIANELNDNNTRTPDNNTFTAAYCCKLYNRFVRDCQQQHGMQAIA